MSLWICPKCKALQGFVGSMTCGLCGDGPLEFATIGSASGAPTVALGAFDPTTNCVPIDKSELTTLSAPKPTPEPLNCRECGHDWLTPCDDRRCGKPHCFCRSCVIEPTPEPTPALEREDVLRLLRRLKEEREAIDKDSDGGNKGYQCLCCGEWDHQHTLTCDVLFKRAIEVALSLTIAASVSSDSTPALRVEVAHSPSAAFVEGWYRGLRAEVEHALTFHQTTHIHATLRQALEALPALPPSSPEPQKGHQP